MSGTGEQAEGENTMTTSEEVVANDIVPTAAAGAELGAAEMGAAAEMGDEMVGSEDPEWMSKEIAQIDGGRRRSRKNRGAKKGKTRKGNKMLSSWVAFVKKVQREENISYSDAMKRASARKKEWKRGQTGGEGEIMPSMSNSMGNSMSNSMSNSMGKSMNKSKSKSKSKSQYGGVSDSSSTSSGSSSGSSSSMEGGRRRRKQRRIVKRRSSKKRGSKKRGSRRSRR